MSECVFIRFDLDVIQVERLRQVLIRMGLIITAISLTNSSLMVSNTFFWIIRV